MPSRRPRRLATKNLNTKADPALQEEARPNRKPLAPPSLIQTLAHQLAEASRIELETDVAEGLCAPFRELPHTEQPHILMEGGAVNAGIYFQWVNRQASRRREALQWQILDQEPAGAIGAADVLVLLQIAARKVEGLDLEEGNVTAENERDAILAGLRACILRMQQDWRVLSPLDDGALVHNESWAESVAVARAEAAKIATQTGKTMEPPKRCPCFECNRSENGGRY